MATMAIAALVFAAACGSDDTDADAEPAPDETADVDEPDATEPETTEPETTEPEDTDDPAPDPSEGRSLEGEIVGFVLSGPVNDGGYYEAQFDALNNLSEVYGFEPKFIEDVIDPADQIQGMRNLANEGAVIVFGDGTMGPTLAEVAPEFPDVQFVVMTAPAPVEEPNLSAYVVQQGVPSYVMGALGVTLSDTDAVGYIGGIEIPPTIETRAGFFEGAEATSPSVSTTSAIVGDFSDVVGAKSAAAAQIANGVDVIYGFVDAGLIGIIQAADESDVDVKIFTATVSYCDLSDRIVGSAIANSEATIQAAIDDYLAGVIGPGTVYFGLEDPNIQSVELCPGFDTPENQALVDEVTEAINAGEVELSSETTGIPG